MEVASGWIFYLARKLQIRLPKAGVDAKDDTDSIIAACAGITIQSVTASNDGDLFQVDDQLSSDGSLDETVVERMPGTATDLLNAKSQLDLEIEQTVTHLLASPEDSSGGR